MKAWSMFWFAITDPRFVGLPQLQNRHATRQSQLGETKSRLASALAKQDLYHHEADRFSPIGVSLGELLTWFQHDSIAGARQAPCAATAPCRCGCARHLCAVAQKPIAGFVHLPVTRIA
ncbi:hypothetical protein MESS4_530054 [Mesorhizobium sp. STM 4661]|nr:hypothetical protein MESS4_530054 [Mesorhizobium sp. STM 4661]